MSFITQQKRTAPPDIDAAETVRFSWKVVEPQGQREHDVRVAPEVQPLSKKISQSPPHLRPGEQSFSAGL